MFRDCLAHLRLKGGSWSRGPGGGHEVRVAPLGWGVGGVGCGVLGAGCGVFRDCLAHLAFETGVQMSEGSGDNSSNRSESNPGWAESGHLV